MTAPDAAQRGGAASFQRSASSRACGAIHGAADLHRALRWGDKLKHVLHSGGRTCFSLSIACGACPSEAVSGEPLWLVAFGSCGLTAGARNRRGLQRNEELAVQMKRSYRPVRSAGA